MLLLFTGSNMSSQIQNMISTVQIVATRVSNISSKFLLDRTTDEARSACWWNLGRCIFFLSLLFSLFFFFLIYSFFFLKCNLLGPQAYGAHSITYEGAQQFLAFIIIKFVKSDHYFIYQPLSDYFKVWYN